LNFETSTDVTQATADLCDKRGFCS